MRRALGATVVVVYAAALSGMCAPAHAQWTAKAEAGVVAARGNTQTDSANTKLDIARELRLWKHAAGFTGIYASDSTGTTAQRWEARGQSDYKFSLKGFWFASARYEDDRFSGFEYQGTYGTGAGWRFFDDDMTKFIVQLGAGYKSSRTEVGLAEDGVTILPSEQQEEFIGQLGVDFQRVLTPTTKIVDKFLVESGADNTFAQNDFSLQVTIIRSLALAVGYSVRYNTAPPEGFSDTDTLTTLNLVYELK